MDTTTPQIGTLLREWRTRRNRSQMDLALDAGVSTRHLSFVENGRARPSAALVVRLAEELEVPLRDRNVLLLAAGFAPRYGRRGLEEPEMAPVRDALQRVLDGHEPYPALVVDRHWGLVAANAAVGVLTDGVAAHLLQPPVNVLRLSLHPDGMAPRILNLPEWRGHLLDALARQAVSSGDPALATLREELAGLPGGEEHADAAGVAVAEIAVPLRVLAPDGRTALSFLSTRTTFGTATDVTAAELAIESFFPADATTAEHLRG
jgi:transcriptional regulator with XRE-family HTH domain